MKTIPHQAPFAQHPLAQLALTFTGGILTSNLFPSHLAISVSLHALFSGTALLALLRNRTSAAAGSLLLAMFFAGAALAVLEKLSAPASQVRRLISDEVIGTNEPLELTGVLNGPPEFARDRAYLPLRVESLSSRRVELRASGTVELQASFPTPSIKNEYMDLQLRYGARIRVMTTLDRTDKYRNPGVSTLTEYLDRKGYDATGFVKSPLLIERLDDRDVLLPLAWLYDWRNRFQQQIDTRFSAETAGVLDAALLGNRYNLSRASAERFRSGGTFHILVISGLHISFIGGIVFLVARRLTKNRFLQFLLPTTVLWSYALAVGADGSVVRAALMFTFVTLAAVVFRRASSLNALGGAALALLIWRPQGVFDPSLQLTFLSVLSIIVIAWPLLRTLSAIGTWRPTRETPYPPACSSWFRKFCEVLFWSDAKWRADMARAAHAYRLFKTPLAAQLEHYHVQRFVQYIFGAVVVSVGVQLVLLPLLIVYFHRLSLASVILNIGVSLLLATLAVVSLLALTISQLSTSVAAPLFKIANGLDWLMIHSVDPFAKLHLASLRLPEYSGWSAMIYVIYYVPLVLLVVQLSRWRPLATSPGNEKKRKDSTWLALISQIGMLALVVLHPLSAGRTDGQLHVDFLDVGQGDSALVTMPDGTNLLVDGGGRPSYGRSSIEPPGDVEGETVEQETRSIGEAVVSEYLWWRGLDHVDYLLATHADADHIDGLNDVARNFAVQRAFVARRPPTDPGYSKFAQTLASTGTPINVLQEGDVMRFGSVEASVLWPPPTENINAPSRNNDSLVIRLRFGERALLLTGDIETGAENALVRAPTDLHVDVVKVAHHGSKTSSTEKFVASARPSLAIISVGQTSVFGHPHKEVVERWKASGAEVLTTGACGTITVTTDGRALRIERFVKSN
jgi:competence protein ComEC